MDQAIVEQHKMPDGKSRCLAQFNKITGELVSVLTWVEPETLNNDYFVYDEVMFDFSNDEIIGTYGSHQVVDKKVLPEVITEEQLDIMARDKITKEYKVVRQVNILGRAILKLSEAAGIEQDELQEMLDYIQEVKKANAIRKEYYKESPLFTYKSYQDLEDENMRRLEGGLHEAYGPRASDRPGVF